MVVCHDRIHCHLVVCRGSAWYLCLLNLLVAGVPHDLHLGPELLGFPPQVGDQLHHLLTLQMDPVILPAGWRERAGHHMAEAQEEDMWKSKKEENRIE